MSFYIILIFGADPAPHNRRGDGEFASISCRQKCHPLVSLLDGGELLQYIYSNFSFRSFVVLTKGWQCLTFEIWLAIFVSLKNIRGVNFKLVRDTLTWREIFATFNELCAEQIVFNFNRKMKIEKIHCFSSKLLKYGLLTHE